MGHSGPSTLFHGRHASSEVVAVDVSDLQTHPAGINGAPASPIMLAADEPQDIAYFGHAEHDQQFLLPGRAHKFESLLFPFQGVLEE